jgi:hypothetical protein
MTAKMNLTGQPLAKTARTPPTTAQILTQQKADAEREKVERERVERERAEREAMLPDTRQQLASSTALTAPAITTSDEALERHLSEWGGSGGRLVAFNGSTGIHRTVDDGVEVPSGTEDVAFLHETQRGHIKFNNGAPPDVCMISISADAEVPPREELATSTKANGHTAWTAERRTPGSRSLSR